ncbi:MAG: bifunctional 5,10-methylenetetrahydrofolate dehydrogenase/5,10-methenyltetrahydrofolate cyclohydrolase [Planctomycetes bacterium]|jgi:methylenetetrahydrofolate dehydrogenase (NADP+)/methenyltetrahydrofolate cyclohydrolase|nr:bifunctional 5,10-methylenetetrahydrofolate dehydrogenase/5,10-methenyltetrahydrofolate cyclohydrolase [Planctomycetota bacterium]
MKIINGKKIAEKVKDDIVKEVHSLIKNNFNRPCLAIILVGNRSDSKLYVSLKEKEAKSVGIDTHLYKFPNNIKEKDLLDVISFLNKDSEVHGILIQLPLPKHLNTDNIIKAINPQKDADGFHPNKNPGVISPVYASVLQMLSEIKFNPKNKKIFILCNSLIFGNGLAELLKKAGGIITVSQTKNKNEIKTHSLESDLFISAIGRANFITKEFIKTNSVIIDIGISKDEGKRVKGDFDFEDIKNKASYITPVPGGIGPLTIAMLFKNVLFLYKNNSSLKN